MKKWLAAFLAVTCMLSMAGCDGSELKQAGLNTLMGMGMVFLVLFLLIILFSFFRFIPMIQNSIENKKKAKAADADVKANAVDHTIAQIIEKEETELSDDFELVAVISAAIAAYEGTSSDGFVVRSIKKKTTKWQRA